MAESYITRRGGGGGTLSWNIVTGLTAPAVKAGGIWAEISTPVKDLIIWFDYIRPTSPANNTLFIRYAGKPGYPLCTPIDNTNGIRYQVASCQLYTTANGWQNVNAYRVENGQWVQFSQGEYYIYVTSANMSYGNKLQKCDLDGTVQWEYQYDTSHWVSGCCVDIVSRSVFTTYNSRTGNTYYCNGLVELDMDTGELKGSWGVQQINTFQNRMRLQLSADRSLVFLSPAQPVFTGGSGFYHLDRTENEIISGISGETSIGMGSIHALPDGTVWGIRASGAYLNLVCGYPALQNPFGNYTTQYTTFGARSDGTYQWIQAFSTIGITNYGILPSTIVNGNSVLKGIYSVEYLPNGDAVQGALNCLAYFTIAADGAPTKYKQLTIAAPQIQNIFPLPDGRIVAQGYYTSGATFQNYLVDTEDNVTTLNVVGLVEAVDPGQSYTFPELFA